MKKIKKIVLHILSLFSYISASLFKNLFGTLSNTLQIGKNGPRLKNLSGILQARNQDDSDFTRIQAATPQADDDVTIRKYTHAINKAVTVPGDYSTIQSAIDSFTNRILDNCKISISSGDYSSEILDFSKIKGSLTLEGDTRTLAGHTWIHGMTIRSTNAGSGTASLANSGNDITITGSTSNPDLTGYTGTVAIIDNNGTYAEYTISSASGNTLTLTTTAPTVGNNGSAITIIPNVKIDGIGIHLNQNHANNIYFLGIRASNIILDIGNISLENCYITGNISCDNGSTLKTEGSENSIIKSTLSIINKNSSICNLNNSCCIGISTNNKIDSKYNSNISLEYANIVNIQYIYITKASTGILNYAEVIIGGGIECLYCSRLIAEYAKVQDTKSGFIASFGSKIKCEYATALNCDSGFTANAGSVITCRGATAQNCEIGYHANLQSYIYAANTSSNNSGNTTDYSPALSNTEGNVNSVITYS